MPGNYQVVTVGKQPQRIQTWLAPNESFLLVNNDITNQIFIGNDPSSQPIPVPPLGSVTLTSVTGHDTWVSTGGVNISVQALLLPQGSQWTPSPAQVAAQINALGLATSANQGTQIANQGTINTSINGTPNSTAALIATGSAGGSPGGAPLLRKTQQLGVNAAGVLLGASGVGTLVNAVIVNQPSYELSLNLKYTSTSGTIPFVQINVVWFDSSSGLTTYQETYYALIGTSGTPVQTYLTGPCHGNEMTMQIINLDSGQGITYFYVVNATSHIYSKALLLQPVYSTVPNFSNPAGFPDTGVLFASAPSVAPNTTTTRLIAPSASLIDISVDNNGQANGVAVTLTDPSGTGLLYGTVSTGSLWAQLVAAGVRATFPNVPLPNGPVLLNIRNTGATTNIAPQITGIINNQA